MSQSKSIQQQAQPLIKATYGIDAPGVIRNLLIAGFVAFVIELFYGHLQIKLGELVVDIHGFVWLGISFSLGGFYMLLYALHGKYRHRDHMLKLIKFNGNEQVLDVGTGKGLLLIGAAKKLTTGRAIGIDIWNAEDLTGNYAEATLQNAVVEGVIDKVDVLNENAMNMSFDDNTFDVILSNECLHNINYKSGRTDACAEIARVLKPGGCAIISDHVNLIEYKINFEAMGLKVRLANPYYLKTYPFLRTLIVRKVANR